ncbi:MAG: hypothetical protein PVG50_04975, partial [Thiohalophilus sp.]
IALQQLPQGRQADLGTGDYRDTGCDWNTHAAILSWTQVPKVIRTSTPNGLANADRQPASFPFHCK